MLNHAYATPEAARRDYVPVHAQLTKADLGAQLARRADEWIRHAGPAELLSVILSGGLSPVIVEEDGHVRTGIELSDEPNMLSRLGIIWSDLPPADSRLWEAWLALEGHAREGARRFLHDEVDQSIPLFEACAEAWLREK
jgi:hypothetical protein